MWMFSAVALIEQQFGIWYALVTLTKNSVPESFFIKFESQPTTSQAEQAGTNLALKKNLEEASHAIGEVMTRDEFFNRFTNAEITAIYTASELNGNIFAYIKRMEINPVIYRSHPDVQSGLQLLETEGLLAAGRVNEILGL